MSVNTTYRELWNKYTALDLQRKPQKKVFCKIVQRFLSLKRRPTWSPALAERETALAFALESLPAFPPAYKPNREGSREKYETYATVSAKI